MATITTVQTYKIKNGEDKDNDDDYYYSTHLENQESRGSWWPWRWRQQRLLDDDYYSTHPENQDEKDNDDNDYYYSTHLEN